MIRESRRYFAGISTFIKINYNGNIIEIWHMIKQLTLKIKQLLHSPLFWVLLLIFIVKLSLIYKMNGTDWEPDAYEHFLQLRTVFGHFPQFWTMGISEWSKPLFTFIIGAIVNICSSFSLSSVQIVNLLLSEICAFLIYKITTGISKNKALGLVSAVVYALGWLSFQSSLTAMTEPLYALMLTVSIYFCWRRQYSRASIFMGLSVLARFEGIVILGIFCLWLILISPKKNKIAFLLKQWLLAVMLIIIWNLIGWAVYHDPLFLLRSGYGGVQSGSYGYGNWWHYLGSLAIKEPLAMLLFTLASGYLYYLLIVKNKKVFRENIKLLWLCVSVFISYLIFQSILWVYGLFGSAGLLRYFVGVMPFAVVAGIAGWQVIANLLKDLWQRLPKFWQVITPAKGLVIIEILFVLAASYLSLGKAYGWGKPSYLPTYPTAFAAAGNWIKTNIPATAELYSTRPEVVYFATRDYSNTVSCYRADMIPGAPVGTYFLWTGDWGQVCSGKTVTEIKSLGQVVYDNSATAAPQDVVIIVKK
jgi:hypothetical protein